jgi:rRNA processing
MHWHSWAYAQELDSEGLHPSRSQRLAAPEEEERVEKSQRHGKTKSRKTLTKEEKLALAEERRKEMERNQKERQKKIKQRERKRRDLRKMTSKGQPVMKTRLEDLLSKVKNVMKDT